MSCDYTEKVSLLIDGDLSEEESDLVIAHIKTCHLCRKTEEELLSLRQMIRDYEGEPDPVVQKRALARIMASENTFFWKRSVAVPAPAFAFLIAVLVVLAGWSVVRLNGSPQVPAVKRVEIRSAQDSLDLSSFDSGERAVIYKVRRSGNSLQEER